MCWFCVVKAKGLATMMPMNSVAVAAGGIRSIEQVAELGYYGYDAVVLGRYLAEVPDIQDFVRAVHSFRGPPRGVGNLGLKGSQLVGGSM
jgi:3-keto-L-gulonate-6-phosphate decarboxylase